jgi:Gpi18-like mannosyltransferase
MSVAQRINRVALPVVRSSTIVSFGFLLAGLAVGAAIRLFLLPSNGLRLDLDLFVSWVHGIATRPFGEAFDLGVTFPPTMVYVWGVLAAVEPAFWTVADAADPAIRTVMKIPASIADLGIAVVIWWGLRERPLLAATAATLVVLHPTTFGVSAFWGQYEPIYVLPAAIAAVLVARGHADLSGVAIGIAAMAKPQAAPLILPLVAYWLATGGPLGLGRRLAILGGTILVLWLPFLAAGGPARYLETIDFYQNGNFAVLSMNAWNGWWLLQWLAGGGMFVSDIHPILGPITPRIIGFGMAGLLGLSIAYVVYRRPTLRTLAIGLAAMALVTFSFLTTMHERYAYAAIVFLAFALVDVRMIVLWFALGIIITANTFMAIPTQDWWFLAPLGSVAMVALTVATLAILFGELRRGADEEAALT